MLFGYPANLPSASWPPANLTSPYRKIGALLKAAGWLVNDKRVDASGDARV